MVVIGRVTSNAYSGDLPPTSPRSCSRWRNTRTLAISHAPRHHAWHPGLFGHSGLDVWQSRPCSCGSAGDTKKGSGESVSVDVWVGDQGERGAT